MTAQLVVIGAIFVLLASVFAFLIDPGARDSAAVPSSEPVAVEDEGGEQQSAEPSPPQSEAEQAPAATEPNRANCDLIRGTQYQSATERDWYRANCR